MNTEPDGSSNSGHQWQAAGLIGGGIALGPVMGVLLYLWLDPAIEGRGDWLEEFQGLLSNVVPLSGVAGGLLGWWASRKLGPAR